MVRATGLRAGMDVETAADILYTIGSPETYRLLVVDRGWSAARFGLWYAETLERLLLDPEPGAMSARWVLSWRVA